MEKCNFPILFSSAAFPLKTVFFFLLHYLDIYRTNMFHLTSTGCALVLQKDLEFWGIDELMMEPCCALKYYPEIETCVNEKQVSNPMQECDNRGCGGNGAFPKKTGSMNFNHTKYDIRMCHVSSGTFIPLVYFCDRYICYASVCYQAYTQAYFLWQTWLSK